MKSTMTPSQYPVLARVCYERVVSLEKHNMYRIIQFLKKSCYDIGDICPIRTEISIHEYWENVFILLFV